MPGIYLKPPCRLEFASDIRCLVEAATDRLNCGGHWDTYVHTLVEEIEAERIKARQEEFSKCIKEEGRSDLNASGRQRTQFQQMIARKEVEVAEVFFECGVHEFFCKALENAEKSLNPMVFEQILGVYQVFQLVEYDPFDDDMGLVSLLNYFLSERHSYYIDIHWRDSELSHMQVFLSAFIRFISFRISNNNPSVHSQSTASGSEDETRRNNTDPWAPLLVTATRILHTTLWTFPPHRVVSRMALSFSRLHCSQLLGSFGDMLAGTPDPDEQLVRLQAEAVAAVAFFGVGPYLVRKAVPAALCWSCSSFICRHIRCPCSTCEFHRRLLKLVRNRDELGVQASTEAKRQICYSLVRAGVANFLDKVLRAATATARKRTEGAKLHPLAPVTASTFQAIAWILMLCSWAYEDVHQGQSILSANNLKLLTSSMEALEAIYADSPDIELFCGNSASTLLRVVVCLVSRTKVVERRNLMLVAKPTFLKIASCLCTRLIQLSPEKSSTNVLEEQPKPKGSPLPSKVSGPQSPVPATDTSLDPKERALTTSPLLFSLVELIFDFELAPGSTSKEIGKQEQEPKVALSTTGLALQACISLVETYEYLHPRFANLKQDAKVDGTEKLHELSAVRAPEDITGQAGFEAREFFFGVIGIMAVLMGGLALQGVEQIRWRFVENPAAVAQPASAGGLASTARSMFSHYKKAQDEGCQIIKKLANLVILRSEQAAGVVLCARNVLP